MFKTANWGAIALAGLIIQAVFLFTGPSVLLSGRGVFGAIRESFVLAWGDFMQTIIIVAVPFALALPATLLELKSDTLAMRLSPDILTHVQIFGELLGFFSCLILVGGLTIAFIWRRADEDKRH